MGNQNGNEGITNVMLQDSKYLSLIDTKNDRFNFEQDSESYQCWKVTKYAFLIKLPSKSQPAQN